MNANNITLTLGSIALGLQIVVLIGIVGHMDYQDEILEASRYCANVYEGTWPDYRGIYEKECKNGKHYLEAE